VNAVNSVFLDTSGLIAAANTDDEWHSSVLSVWQGLIAGDYELITTTLVLIELGDGLSRVHLRRLAIELYDRIRISNEIHVVQVTAEIETLAWQMFRQHSDKEWSVTDCASFAVMRQRAIRLALTTDRHFDQAGFERLVKP
jgi:hypothetical protein